MTAPITPNCIHCGNPAKLRVGSEVYPHRRDLWTKFFYVCEPCDARCGCHGVTKVALGFPANAQLRKARMSLHDFRLDLIWKNAVKDGGYGQQNKKAAARITRSARERTYKFLAERMGVKRDDCHTAMFTLEQCRMAWKVLHGITYADVRKWSHSTEPKIKARMDAFLAKHVGDQEARDARIEAMKVARAERKAARKEGEGLK